MLWKPFISNNSRSLRLLLLWRFHQSNQWMHLLHPDGIVFICFWNITNLYLSCQTKFTFPARWYLQRQHLVWHFNQNCELHWVALNRMHWTNCPLIRLPNFSVKALCVLEPKGCRWATRRLPSLAAVVAAPIQIVLLLWLELKPKDARMLNRDCIIVRIPCLIYVVLGNILLNLWSFLSILKTIKYTG